MRKIIFIIFVLPFYLSAQVYKAGDTLVGYVDINPDTLLSFGGQYHLENYTFDVTNDLQNDFKIESYSSGGLGGATRYINIIPLDTKGFVRFGRTDSVYNSYLGFWQKAQIAKPLSYGDSINLLNPDWRNVSLALTNNSGMTGTYLYTQDWVSVSDLFVGIKYHDAPDTIYGWVRVHCPNNANCFVKDFSFSKCSNSSLAVTSSSNVICASESVTLSASGANTYTWSTGSTNASIIVAPTVTTTYTVQGNTNGCSASSVITQSINPAPSLTVSSSSNSICALESVTITASGANTYTWSTGNINPDIIVNPGVTTSYTVTGSNTNGCSTSAFITQVVDPCVGINEYNLNKIKIYPNPAANLLQISDETHAFQNSKIEIINYLGQSVFMQNYSGEVDVSRLSPGLYTIEIITADKKSVYAKFIKE